MTGGELNPPAKEQIARRHHALPPACRKKKAVERRGDCIPISPSLPGTRKTLFKGWIHTSVSRPRVGGWWSIRLARGSLLLLCRARPPDTTATTGCDPLAEEGHERFPVRADRSSGDPDTPPVRPRQRDGRWGRVVVGSRSWSSQARTAGPGGRDWRRIGKTGKNHNNNNKN